MKFNTDKTLHSYVYIELCMLQFTSESDAAGPRENRPLQHQKSRNIEVINVGNQSSPKCCYNLIFLSTPIT